MPGPTSGLGLFSFSTPFSILLPSLTRCLQRWHFNQACHYISRICSSQKLPWDSISKRNHTFLHLLRSSSCPPRSLRTSPHTGLRAIWTLKVHSNFPRRRTLCPRELLTQAAHVGTKALLISHITHSAEAGDAPLPGVYTPPLSRAPQGKPAKGPGRETCPRQRERKRNT